jgi:hypothetical protein
MRRAEVGSEVGEHVTVPLGDGGDVGEEMGPHVSLVVTGLVASGVSWFHFTTSMSRGFLGLLVMVASPAISAYAAMLFGRGHGHAAAGPWLWGSRRSPASLLMDLVRNPYGVLRRRETLPLGDLARSHVRLLVTSATSLVVACVDLATGALVQGGTGWWAVAPGVRVAIDLASVLVLGYLIGFSSGTLLRLVEELAPRLPRGGPFGGDGR